jgi:flavodoxin
MTQENVISSNDNHNALTIFYSRTGKTRIIAETIKDTLGGKLQEIIDLKDRSGFRGYMSGVIDIFFQSITEISPRELNLDHYDLLFIGSPIWGNKFPPAITTFFSRAQFSDKKVVLFADFGSHIKKSKHFRSLKN